MRVGIGYDSHRLVSGRKLILGGVEIPFEKGLLGHSDADVLCHAITDAILGASGMGDMGTHFPDTDQQWKNASSIDLLSRIITLIGGKGYKVKWIDSIVIAEKPKIQPYLAEMRENLSKAGIASDTVNIKATSNEGMGFVGKEEGMAAQAVCLLMPS